MDVVMLLVLVVADRPDRMNDRSGER